MQKNGVILKPGKEKALLQRHPWIFSGAIASYPPFQAGDLLQVYSSQGQLLGSGYFNPQGSLVGRMVTFEDKDPLQAIAEQIDKAIQLRKALISEEKTNGYRLINGEGDGLPGLIVDRYDTVLVIQISTLGMERLKPYLVDLLKQKMSPSAIYEKSVLPSRKEEGLPPSQGVLLGHIPDEVIIRENGFAFAVSILEGQKTGFFLDHREMRAQIGKLANHKRVLNCFSYTGGFSVYAAASGAVQVDSVDISAEAIAGAKRNFQLNNLDQKKHRFFDKDVFTFLREEDLNYDIVILDPPAFAKRKKDIISACRGYKDINRIAMQKMASGSLLLTSSCSYYVDEDLFQKVIYQAALESKKFVRIIGKHRLGADHPINIYHPEGAYLKSLLLYIE